MSLEQRTQRLREAGYKLTHARLTVLQVLEQQHEHLTSTQVIDAVAAIDPSIGRASVFRTLDLLTELTLIRPTYIDGSATPVYVLLPNGHHHHIVCTGCNRVIEFDDCGLAELEQRLETQYQVKLTGHLLEFYGRCSLCVLKAENTA
ncbi:MAG: transcriptional repressor [Anaerolineae bacterium]|jgi:Fur family ferric uptake transcriptional regulator|nr:transcriptional repressor [Anaerolineae bacterium]